MPALSALTTPFFMNTTQQYEINLSAVTGTPGNLACSEESTSTFGGRTSTVTHRFSGALSGGVISGMVTFAFTGQGSNPGTSVTDSASTTYPVTLR